MTIPPASTLDEAYVAIGGATVLSAGKKGSIMNFDDDAPFNWLGLFLSEKVDAGVKWTKDLYPRWRSRHPARP